MAEQPRDYLARPKSYGKFAQVEWRQTPKEQGHLLLAAQWNHLVVVGIRDALQYAEKTPEWLGQEAGIGRNQIWRYLRGESFMPLPMLALVEQCLGVRFIAPSFDAPPRAGSDVEPPG